jgi:hypothetical protein
MAEVSGPAEKKKKRKRERERGPRPRFPHWGGGLLQAASLGSRVDKASTCEAQAQDEEG